MSVLVKLNGEPRDLPDGSTVRQAVAELTAANASITWSVHLRNEKAAWYEFQLAMDIPEVADAKPAERRNFA